MLKQELIIAGCAALLVAFVATFAVYWYIGRTGRQQSEDEIIGGRALSESPKDVARMMKKRGEASDIRIDDLPLKLDSEIQNMSMHGTVSTGKSTLMRKIMKQLRDRGDLVIIYDKGCTFIEDFYDESRDKVLNALDARCPNWDLWEECRTISELENASATLIPASSGEDPFWQGSARTIFAEGAERMRRDEDRSYNKFLRTLLAIQLDQLRTFLAGTPASTLVDGKIEKTAISIRSVLTNYVKAMRYLQGIDRPGREKFTIREWMKGQADKSKNGWLFITSDEQNHESLKPLISLWLSIAATSLLAMGPNRQRRVWFFYDELASLHKLPTLPRIISEARKFGGCFVLGFQSFAQLEEIYGPKAAAALFDLLNTKFFFRSPSAQIAKFVEEDVGETWRKKFSEQTSFGHEQVRDGISFGKEEERVSIVSYSDVQSLNDLQCFVTLPGSYPVVKLTMKYEAMAGFTQEGAIRFRQGEQEKIVDPQSMTEDRHIDLAYALTVYGVQGASERFAIALTGTEGGRKRMASLESTYVTLSRAKEHVQVYTDNLEDWQQQVRQSDGGKTAHDLLHEKSDRESDTGNRLLATASRLDKTALGRRVLAENGLEGETMARFIAAGKKYPSPYVALPVWTRHGKEAGALLTEIRIEDDGMRVVLSEESRLRGGEDAQFTGWPSGMSVLRGGN
ncbi:putative type IV conjugative transfer system coupling protein TraD (plasmid) [Escherichia coli O139:H28 str. E24377A]|uniref:Putative type IV conjugative transfer system coupling protein TraD n=4 Tax=Escherichia coli TaxID=562 RepID=A7ZH89_ECO24|nr:putative type IV conjugative transfer system coupling protein TraD [Escherichia coli O139:H28 str. E24377A]APG37972.1 type IV conjugative transfer system coupling protein TraD [Escherichia coli]EMV56570.1 type IV conjugative transfer system coupling protein TraD [Escherichia coli 2872000]EMZ51977.1 type IV conjugative transfer system coupling protein TraD [Escherichia coli 2846750]EYV85830.1 conjugal transfer protein TraD [Escherichia coli O6:H16 str. 99-3165]EZA80575.1 conjugal transfer pr